MSILKIKKILETKEKLAKIKASKSLQGINLKKENIRKIGIFRDGYLSTTRKIGELDGFALQNTSKFINNLEYIALSEEKHIEHDKIVYNKLNSDWMKSYNKLKQSSKVIENRGIESAFIMEYDNLFDLINTHIILLKRR